MSTISNVSQENAILSRECKGELAREQVMVRLARKTVSAIPVCSVAMEYVRYRKVKDRNARRTESAAMRWHVPTKSAGGMGQLRTMKRVIVQWHARVGSTAMIRKVGRAYAYKHRG